MSGVSESVRDQEPAHRRLARVILFAFLLAFVAARASVFLIMSRRIPDLYLYVGGTHVHHLNHGSVVYLTRILIRQRAPAQPRRPSGV